MLKRSIITMAIAAAGALAPVWSQSPGSSFQNFRNEVLSRYDSFRSEVLANYDSFLEGVWKEYDSFRGVERSSVPKPERQPLFSPESAPKVTPTIPEPKAEVTPAVPEVKPEAPREERSMPVPGKPAPVKPVPAKPVPAPAAKTMPVDFYGMEVELPRPEFSLGGKLTDERAYASAWRSLAADKSVASVIASLRAKAGELGLNDYLTFDLVNHWVDGVFKTADRSSRLSLVHYIMANMGYDVRIARTGSGLTLLLVPFEQTVYARRYMNIDGKRYYIFTGDIEPDLNGQSLYTCNIPAQMDAGRKLDLTLNGLRLPYKPHAFDVSYGDIHISGEVNANIFPVIYKYPQMPTSGYALSVIDPKVRAGIVEQVKSQVDAGDPRAAADKILSFVQSGFSYATDGDFHGFEKPYFFEEMLYYDKCDCEDRAVFYTYLLWNVLGLESQLLCYPGHESASVKLDDGKPGVSYQYKGDRFYISDPTYIGASTGMCMPAFVNVSPEIDYTFK